MNKVSLILFILILVIINGCNIASNNDNEKTDKEIIIKNNHSKYIEELREVNKSLEESARLRRSEGYDNEIIHKEGIVDEELVEKLESALKELDESSRKTAELIRSYQNIKGQ